MSIGQPSIHMDSTCPTLVQNNLFYFKNVSALASLHCRCYLTPVSNVCKAVAISLFSALNGLNKLLEMHFKFPFNLINIDNGTFNRAIMVRSQILVHRREPRTWISALFYRPTYPEVKFLLWSRLLHIVSIDCYKSYFSTRQGKLVCKCGMQP